MATSVHIPKPLLEAVDRRARTLKISRNRVIVRALERELNQGTQWSPGFFEELASPGPGTGAAAEELLKGIEKNRHSKKPVEL
jgi:hypothetical protein